jgi:hypothetical protein
MKRSLRIGSWIVAVAAVGCVFAWSNLSHAEEESSVTVAQPVVESPNEQSASQPELVPAVPTAPVPSPRPQPFLVPDGEVYQQEELASPQSAVTVHPVARIDYDVTHRARKLFGGSPFVELSMVTQNPADGCFYEIPMCLPACCTGEPKVTSYCGLFGRGVVVYCYECGLEIEVKFRLRGDVEVEYGT